ncbi:MAG: hypothetical protein OHK0021_15300 [Bryobacter sp.]
MPVFVRLALRRLALLFAAFVLLLLGWLGWGIATEDATTLTRIGNFLWTQEEPLPADLICILGGDYLRRAPLAAQLYSEGFATKILVPREDMGWKGNQAANGQEHFSDATLRILREKGVPETALVDWKVKSGVTSTAEELRALAIYADLFPDVRRVLIISSHYHTRRISYTAGRVLPSRLDYRVLGAPVEQWSLASWWAHPVGRQTIREEYLKLFYYLPRYLFG